MLLQNMEKYNTMRKVCTYNSRHRTRLWYRQAERSTRNKTQSKQKLTNIIHRDPRLPFSGPPRFPGRAARVMSMSIIAIAMPTPFNPILPTSVPFLTVLVSMSVSVLTSVARKIIVMSVMPR